jgi:hypothetical protein
LPSCWLWPAAAEPPRRPSLGDSALGGRQARRSERVDRGGLGGGDICGAAQQADDLRHAVEDAIAAGEIPAAYQDELQAAVENLQNTANCTGEGDEDKEHGKGKAKGHDKHDEGVTITTDTLGTTTEESD